MDSTIDLKKEEIIFHYFTQLSESQRGKFKKISSLYAFWNTSINLISRKDIAQLYLRHVLYALSIAKVISFKAGTKILDVGTGGGFPGIPLAIMFPRAQFHLIDSIGKKIKAVKNIAEELVLDNVYTNQIRAEEVSDQYDFILGRGVADLPTFYHWIKDNLKKDFQNDLPNGILYLKGGNFLDELTSIPLKYCIYPIGDFFNESFFETKKLVYLHHF